MLNLLRALARNLQNAFSGTETELNSTRRQSLLASASLIGASHVPLFGTASAQRASNEPRLVTIATVLELKQLQPDVPSTQLRQAVLCLGYHEKGDGGGGVFYWHADTDKHTPRSNASFSVKTSFGGSWMRADTGGQVNAKWFGAVGDGRSDDTEPLHRAIQHLMSTGPDTWPPFSPGRPTLYLPRGIYKTGALPVLSHTQNLRIIGDGSAATTLILLSSTTNDEEALFTMGKPLVDPADQWSGDGQGLEISHVHLTTISRVAEGTSKPRLVGVRDNGSGELIIKESRLSGFSYAVLAPFGSDFSRFSNTAFRENECAIYLGPGSQQVSIAGCNFSRNIEAVVLDAVPQGEIQSCYFMDQGEVDVRFEYTGPAPNPTRFGARPHQKIYRGMFAVKDCWFETGTRQGSQGSQGSLRCHIHVNNLIRGNQSQGPGGILVLRSFVVSGVKNMLKPKQGTVSFWLNESGENSRIQDLRVWGSYIDTLVTDHKEGAVTLDGVLRV